MKKQSGSAFFYIIIAIFLFAAVTYTVMQNSRSGEGGLSREKASLTASEIIEYGNIVAGVVQKLKLRGCSDTEISFENGIVTGYTNGTNTSCQVFHTNGGAINYQDFTGYSGIAEPLIFTGANQVQNVNTTAGDLLLLIGDLSSLSLCEALNERIGLTATPANLTATTTKFVGTYANATTISNGGALSGCYDSGGAGSYYFYQVLIAR